LTQEKFDPQTIRNSREASPKFSEGPKALNLIKY